MEVLSLISDEREFQKAIHKYLVVYNCLLNLEAYNKDPIFFSSCYFVGHFLQNLSFNLVGNSLLLKYS